MSMLKFDPESRPNFPLEHSDVRSYYQNVAAQTLLSVRQRWRFIASCVALAMALAFIIIPLLPRKYSATALIYPSLYSQDQGKIVALASVNAESVVNGEARLIVSDVILQAVVRRLGLEQQPEASQSLGWLRALFFPETRSYSPFDRQVVMLQNRVEVRNDTRSYLISISFTASSADEAARIVNTIAVEYIRAKAIQRKRDAVTAAEIELARQLAVNGDKHPKVLQAADELGVARVALKAVMAPGEDGQDAVTADEGVKLAIPNRTPTSPKGLVILGLSFLLSSLAGIGLVMWSDRRSLEPRQVLLDLLLPRLRSGQLFISALLDRLAGRRFGADFIPEAAVWQRLGVGLASACRRALAALNFRAGRQQSAALPSGSDERSGTDEIGAACSSGRRRRLARRFKQRNIVGCEDHPPGP
jgi:capsular polysaccharide biosynthesis protein